MPKKLIIKEVTDEKANILRKKYLVGAEDVHTYNMGECFIIKSTEKGRLHVSISTPYRLPTWNELVTARYELMPKEMMVVQVMPPPEMYVNLHSYCLHLWECKDELMGCI